MSWEPIGHRQVRPRIEIGARAQPERSRDEIAAQRIFDQERQALRLRCSEYLWRTIVEAAGAAGIAPIEPSSDDDDLTF